MDLAAPAPDTTWEEEGCSSTVKTSTAFLRGLLWDPALRTSTDGSTRASCSCSCRRNADLVFASADRGAGMLLFTDLGSPLGIPRRAGRGGGGTFGNLPAQQPAASPAQRPDPLPQSWSSLEHPGTASLRASLGWKHPTFLFNVGLEAGSQRQFEHFFPY